MRVLILSPESPPRTLLRSLASLGVELIVARPGADTEADGLVQFVRVSARGNAADPMDLRWSRRSLRAVVRDVRPSLMHVVGDPWTPTAEAGAAAARSLGIPYVLVGSASIGGPRSLTARWQADRIRNGAAGRAGIVRSALEHLSTGASPKPTAVLPMAGIAIPSIIARRPDPPPVVFGVVGRLMPERGVHLLLDALSGTYGEWVLRVAGTGPSQVALEDQAQRLGLSSRIEWLGAVPRVSLPEMWQGIHVIVAPSVSTPEWVEPTGRAVLQAMAYGVAPIVTRCGALPDVVGEGGLIVDESDVPALTRALQGFVSDPSRCALVGAAARHEVLERFGDGPVAERMVQLWRQVLQP